jgi:hypothetical protein
VAAQAVGVINNIAAQVENHEAVVQAGAISKIVALLNALVYKPSLPKSAHEDISNAAGVLGNLATEPAAQRQIIKAGALKPLIRVLERTDAGASAKAFVAGALWNL